MIKESNRVPGIDFARVICAIGIICYHFAGRTDSAIRYWSSTANESWGGMLVHAFFAMSGAVLFLNYPTVDNCQTFYYKRWKAIFPSFYLCYVYFFIMILLDNIDAFSNRNPALILYSLLGMDGYFYYMKPNFYIVGEWFLGAIILLYILYPFISKVKSKLPWLLPIVLLLALVFVDFTDFFQISINRNLITCLLSFYLGILAAQYRQYTFNNTIWGIVAIALSVLLYFLPIPFIKTIAPVQGVLFFISCTFIGECITKFGVIKRFIQSVSAVSFEIFLFQNRIIGDVIKSVNPRGLGKSLIVLIMIICLTYVCAVVLKIVRSAMVNSNLYMRIEKRFFDCQTKQELR